MKSNNMRKWSNHRLLFSIFGIALLCLLGLAISNVNTHTVGAASPTNSRLTSTPAIQSVRMVNQTTGWATAKTTMILHTIDGGNHWTNVTPPYGIVAMPQSFVATFKDAQHAWVAYEPKIGGSTFTILRTANGGVSWQKSTVSTTSGFGISSLTFNGNLNGWILVGDNGGPGAGSESFALFATKNGGASWTRLPDIHTTDRIVRVSFVDAQNGYLTYGGSYAIPHMSVTHNGGRSWQEIALPAMKGVSGEIVTTSPVFFGSTGFLPVGVQGSTTGFEMYTSHNNGVTWQTSNSFLALGNNNIGQGGVGDLYIVSPTQFYVTNQQGQTFMNTDGGLHWYKLPGTVGLGVTSLSFINAQQGWAAGNGLLHTSDGGNTWHKVNYTVK